MYDIFWKYHIYEMMMMMIHIFLHVGDAHGMGNILTETNRFAVANGFVEFDGMQ